MTVSQRSRGKSIPRLSGVRQACPYAIGSRDRRCKFLSQAAPTLGVKASQTEWHVLHFKSPTPCSRPDNRAVRRDLP